MRRYATHTHFTPTLYSVLCFPLPHPTFLICPLTIHNVLYCRSLGLQGELSETQDLFDKTVASDLKKYNDSVAKYEGQLKDLREQKLDEKVRYENQIQMLTEDAANTKQSDTLFCKQ